MSSSSENSSPLRGDVPVFDTQHNDDVHVLASQSSTDGLTRRDSKDVFDTANHAFGDTLEPIAIIGFSQNFPGGCDTSEKLWALIVNAKSALSDIPPGRWNLEGFYGGSRHKQGLHKSCKAHFVEQDIAAFDAPFFNITAAEAAFMDPQQRLLLESTYHAFENAGISLESASKSRTGVFVASFLSDYAHMLEKDVQKRPTFASTGNGNAILANRLSWYFNLTGPSVSLDTACSGSFHSLHLACQSLRSRESDMGLIGAANLLIGPETFTALSDSGFLSKEGRSYSFDHRAGGYSRGEGSGVIILKRLCDAIRDRNVVRAVIRGSGANQDGRTLGITLPDSNAQKTLIQETYRLAGLPTSDTHYVEAHGTGTRIGDPIEARAIAEAFFNGTNAKRPLYVGSLKPNLGHMENASGIASLIKAVLILEHGVIPPCALMEKVSERVDQYSGSSLTFPTEAFTWPRPGLRRISLNSFGYGGANCHVILDDALNYSRQHDLEICHRVQRESDSCHQQREDDAPKFISDHPRLLLLSSADKDGIQRTSKAYQDFFHKKSDRANFGSQYLSDLAFTLCERRSHLPWRSSVVIPSSESLFNPKTFDSLVTNPQQAARAFDALFVFTGQGAQWPRMGQDLLSYRIFRESMGASEGFLKSFGCSWSFVEELQKPGRKEKNEEDEDEEDATNLSRLHEPALSQVASTAVQVALVDLLRHWKVEPKAVIGHSSGEIAAAYCIGALSRRSAMKLAYGRALASTIAGRLQSERLGMMAVVMAADDIQAVIDESFCTGEESKVFIACINSPKHVVVSGLYDNLKRLHTQLDEQGVISQFLKVNIAYHSPYMGDVASIYEALIQDLDSDRNFVVKRPTLFSSTTAGPVAPEELLQSSFWVRGLVQPVRFSEALSKILQGATATGPRKLGAPKDLGVNFVLEIGPHPALRSAIHDVIKLKKKDGKVAYSPTLQRYMKDTEALLCTAGHLFAHGAPIDIPKANRLDEAKDSLRMIPDLPSYPFNHTKRFWKEGRTSKTYNQRKFLPHDLLGERQPSSSAHEPRWRHYVDSEDQTWIKDHCLFGLNVYPAAGLLVMVLEAAKQLADENRAVFAFLIRNVIITQSLIVKPDPQDNETETSLKLLESTDGRSLSWYSFRICVFAGLNSHECCTGEVGIEYAQQKGHDFAENLTAQDLLSQEAERAFIEAEKSLKRDVSHDDFYSKAMTAGLDYGPPFRGVNELRVSDTGEAIATSAINSRFWQEHCDYQKVSPHIIHPTVLDCIFQSSNAAISRGFTDMRPSLMVPSRIVSLRILAQPYSELEDPMIRSHVSAMTVGPRTATAKHIAIQETTKIAIIDGVIEYATVEDASSLVQEDPIGCYHVDSKPDFSLMSVSEVTQYCHSVTPSEFRQTYRSLFDVIAEIQRQAISHAMSKLQKDASQLTERPPFFSEYVAFMRRKIAEFESNFKPREDLDRYLDEVASEACRIPEGELAIVIARNLPEILKGSVNPLDLLFENDLLARVYAQGSLEPSFRKAFVTYLDLICHKKPQLRVLEIGAGTGSFSGVALDILGTNGDSNAIGPRFSHYCFTDISSGFFEDAKQRFAAYSDRMEFKLLDIGKDPISQGFQDQDFDIIIAANVLHATPNLSTTIGHVSKLLKPGGKLVIQELMTPDSLRSSFSYGLLPGWWPSGADERILSPLISPDQWQGKLEEHGFSGMDFQIANDPVEKYYLGSLLFASKKDLAPLPPPSDQKLCIVFSTESPIQVRLAAEIGELACSHGLSNCERVNVRDTIWPDFTGRFCVLLADLEDNDTVQLDKLTPPLLSRLKNLLSAARGILWVVGTNGTARDAYAGMPAGLSRAFRTENPSFHFTTLAVRTDKGVDHISDKLNKIFLKALHFGSEEHYEDEFTDIDNLLHIGRIVQATAVDRQMRSHTIRVARPEAFRDGSGRKTAMTIRTPTLLESLQFDDAPFALKPIGVSEIEIDVSTVGVNFRDVMICTGQLDLSSIGCECVGIVREKGPGVTNVDVGDRVACLAPGAFGNAVRCSGSAVVRLPSSISDEVGATIPANVCTVIYAFLHIANLDAGESVFVQSGAGGLGQVAIQVAKYLGATIYTTVSTKEKRDFLHQRYDIPLSHILYSRSLSFATALLHLTDGRGVDVILNSYGGQTLLETWKCIAPFGRFIEVGKKDVLGFAKLPMDMFAQNVTFSTIDLGLIYNERPALVGKLLRQGVELFEAGHLYSVEPMHIFAGSEVGNAIRLIQEGNSIGKAVVKFNDSDLVPTVTSKIPGWSFDSKASYLIAGGLGGLGKSIARWMIERGARNLILLSRRTAYNEQDIQFLANMKTKGVAVLTPPCDIADELSLKSILADCAKKMPPIRGCIQASMVLRDETFLEMKFEDLQAAVRPKVAGSLNLHGSLSQDLDFFIMLSSVSGLAGWPGQSNYAMGNAFQDSLARHRVSMGLKAVCIDLGVVLDVGYIAENTALKDTIQKLGTPGLKEAHIRSTLERYCDPRLPLLSPNECQPIIGAENMAQLSARGIMPDSFYLRPLFHCMNQISASQSAQSENGNDQSNSNSLSKVQSRLRSAETMEAAVDVIIEVLLSKLSPIIGLDKDQMSIDRPLHSYGIDSLVAVEIRNWFRRAVGSDVPMIEILSNVNISELSKLAAAKSTLLGRLNPQKA